MDLKTFMDGIPVVLMGINWIALWLKHAKKLKKKGEDYVAGMVDMANLLAPKKTAETTPAEAGE